MNENQDCGAEFLRSVELFSSVDETWLAELETRLVEMRASTDELVFRAGESAEAVYIVRSGQVAVFTDTPGKAVRLVERVGPGGTLGLVGALGGAQRAASARAIAPTRLLRLARVDLLRLLEKDSNLGLRFTLAAVSRHTRNAAAALELGDRQEIRIRVDCAVDLVIGHRPSVRVNLENLSQGGVCFSGAPSVRFPIGGTWYTLHLPDGAQVLRFHGRVAWRRGDRTGLAFAKQAPGHDLLVQGALRRLLRAAPARGEALVACAPVR